MVHRRVRLAWLAVLLLVQAACADAPPDEADTGAQSTVAASQSGDGFNAYPIDSFPRLPSHVRNELRMQNCGVAQTYDGDESRNVVTGSFASPDQTDWVVLCARGDSTGIVIVWGGPERCPSSLSWTPNDAWMQELDGQRAFSRAVQVADQQFIQEHAEAYGGMAAPSDDHDGVDDVFMGKGSTVRYCHQGAWTELQGAD